MLLTLRELRFLVREALDPTDPKTWERFSPTSSPVELWHVVTDVSSLDDVFRQGLLPGSESGAETAWGGSPAALVYFFTVSEPAALLAQKLVDNGSQPVVLHLRVPAKMLAKLDPRIDPEEEFSGASVAFLPDKRFVINALVSVYTDAPAASVLKRHRERLCPLSDLS